MKYDFPKIRLSSVPRFFPHLSQRLWKAIALLACTSFAQPSLLATDTTDLLAAARESSRAVPSLFLSPAQRADMVEAFVKIVSLPSPSGNEAAVAEELRRRLGSIGATEITCAHADSAGTKFSNLVMEFAATTHSRRKPAVIFNAHIDTIGRGRCTPELLAFDPKKREFFHRRDGSFGADDKAGVAVVLGALKAVKARYWNATNEHRRIIVVFTAQEETGALGAAHLAKEHPQIFENVEITLSCDGNLDYDSPPFYPKSLFVVVAEEKKRGDVPYRNILDYVKEVCDSKGTSFSLTTSGLGMGDFAFFPPQARSQALHIRSPYQGDHRAERVRLDDLFNHIDLFAYILLRLDGTPVNLPSRPER